MPSPTKVTPFDKEVVYGDHPVRDEFYVLDNEIADDSNMSEKEMRIRLLTDFIFVKDGELVRPLYESCTDAFWKGVEVWGFTMSPTGTGKWLAWSLFWHLEWPGKNMELVRITNIEGMSKERTKRYRNGNELALFLNTRTRCSYALMEPDDLAREGWREVLDSWQDVGDDLERLQECRPPASLAVRPGWWHHKGAPTSESVWRRAVKWQTEYEEQQGKEASCEEEQRNASVKPGKPARRKGKRKLASAAQRTSDESQISCQPLAGTSDGDVSPSSRKRGPQQAEIETDGNDRSSPCDDKQTAGASGQSVGSMSPQPANKRPRFSTASDPRSGSRPARKQRGNAQLRPRVGSRGSQPAASHDAGGPSVAQPDPAGRSDPEGSSPGPTTVPPATSSDHDLTRGSALASQVGALAIGEGGPVSGVKPAMEKLTRSSPLGRDSRRSMRIESLILHDPPPTEDSAASQDDRCSSRPPVGKQRSTRSAAPEAAQSSTAVVSMPVSTETYGSFTPAPSVAQTDSPAAAVTAAPRDSSRAPRSSSGSTVAVTFALPPIHAATRAEAMRWPGAQRPVSECRSLAGGSSIEVGRSGHKATSVPALRDVSRRSLDGRSSGRHGRE
ncbi:hypothetical protein FRC12_005548 [Ceratobasidium sp. 428]|nr:hypothetical protein FRC09_000705 [Ceratobasidium sp. 395]KAG8768462.1 hypothetical protein FRC12_005548 [Ceratobasidium sp. 428]